MLLNLEILRCVEIFYFVICKAVQTILLTFVTFMSCLIWVNIVSVNGLLLCIFIKSKLFLSVYISQLWRAGLRIPCWAGGKTHSPVEWLILHTGLTAYIRIFSWRKWSVSLVLPMVFRAVLERVKIADVKFLSAQRLLNN